jgi:hypothetical protein
VGRARGPGPRSIEALSWLAKVDASGIEPLGLALGMRTSTTYSHLQRLAASGYVARVDGGESGAVVMTRDGWRRLGRAVNDVPRGMTYGLGLRHACAVSWVAALLSLRDRTWIAEREMRRQQVWQVPVLWTGSRGTHRPDLGMERDGRRMAIEVELSPKAPRRLRAILAGYEHAIATGGLARVMYILDGPEVERAVARAARQVGLPPGALETRPLKSVRADARRVAEEQS